MKKELFRGKFGPAIGVSIRRRLATGEIDKTRHLANARVKDLLRQPDVNVEVARLTRDLLQVMRLTRKMHDGIARFKRDLGELGPIVIRITDIKRNALMPLTLKILPEIGSDKPTRPCN